MLENYGNLYSANMSEFINFKNNKSKSELSQVNIYQLACL